MEFFVNIFNIFLYRPLFNVLILLYEYLPGHDFGMAVIILTVLIKFLLYPLGTLAIKNQKIIEELQPKIQEVQKKYKDNKAEQARAMMELYRQAKINPFSGFLPLLIQLPILIALYRVFWIGFQTKEINHLYSFLPSPGDINPSFLGIFNLAQPSITLAVIAGISQFFQTKMASPKKSKNKEKGQKKDQFLQFSQVMQKQMLYLFPIFTVLILFKIPSAVALYWAVSNVFTIGQQYFAFKKMKPR